MNGAEQDERRCEILDAALRVFARFGYRKASMDEVAHAAQISRQGLYLNFKTKETLFKETALHMLDSSLAAATEALADESQPLAEKLLTALDAWHGQKVGLFTGNVELDDIAEAGRNLLGDLHERYDRMLAEAMTAALQKQYVSATWQEAGVTTAEIAGALLTASKGLKHAVESREQYLDAMRIIIKVTCAPGR